MKRLLIIIMLFISIGVKGQSIIDHLGKIRMRYNNAGSNDTLLIQFSGDSTYYFSNTNRFHKFKSGLVADSLKLNGGGGWIKTLIPSQWTTSGSNIYYNTGNVGINDATPGYKLSLNGSFAAFLNSGENFIVGSRAIPSNYINISEDDNNITFDDSNAGYNVGIGKEAVYKLDVNGLIAGSNIETNTTSLSTKLGYEAGNSENNTATRLNVFNGYQAGYSLTTGLSNTIIGAYSGYSNVTGSNNTFIGNSSGTLSTSSNNTIIGAAAGSELTSGFENTYLGYYSGLNNQTGGNNVFLGAYAGMYETGSNKLIIDNQDRIDEATARTSALIYGIFHATPASQEVHLNSKVYATHLTSATKGNTLYYDTSTKEISYGATPSGSSTILYSNNVDQVTSGTSETTLYNYDIDGGALLNNGDMIELYIVLVNGNPASTSLVDFLIDTTPVTLFTDLEGNSIVRIIINRVSSTSIKYFISYSYEQGATFGGYMTVTSASSINLTIKATASVSTITGQLFYVKNI